MWASILSLAASLLKLCGWGAAEIHDAEQRAAGRVAQHDADETAANTLDRAARVAEANDAGLPDVDLDQRLRRPGAGQL